ncbi:MAG: DUF998 domain-containing protein [Candidatus Dormiibacterota bacterium]
MRQRRERPGVRLWAGVLWMAVVQSFLVQGLVQARWTLPYSLVRDPISDLGATTCTPLVCSPWHALMNASFVALGLCMAAGALAAEWSSPRVLPLSRVAAALLILSGAGVVVVGLVPENTSHLGHTIGAAAGIVFGNVGTLLTGLTLRRARGLPVAGGIGVGAGVVGLLATLLLAAIEFHTVPSLQVIEGLGERLAVYPILVAVIVAGNALVAGDWRREPRGRTNRR